MIPVADINVHVKKQNHQIYKILFKYIKTRD